MDLPFTNFDNPTRLLSQSSLYLLPDTAPTGKFDSKTSDVATLTSATFTHPEPLAPDHTVSKPLTQTQVEINSQLRRLQSDLLILTGLNENETIHWRPSWFKQGDHGTQFWTLYNPPDVVTESLPHFFRGRKYFTRKLRREGDPPPYFIKSWDAWTRYREMHGIPREFLAQEQIQLLRLGLPKDNAGMPCPPPSYPLYPEPQPRGCGRYILHPSTYRTHLPRKFHYINPNSDVADGSHVVIVHSDGALVVEPREPLFMHPGQCTHYDGLGRYPSGDPHGSGEKLHGQQGAGRRWSYLPWTEEQEKSCEMRLVVKLKVGGAANAKGNGLLRGLMARGNSEL